MPDPTTTPTTGATAGTTAAATAGTAATAGAGAGTTAEGATPADGAVPAAAGTGAASAGAGAGSTGTASAGVPRAGVPQAEGRPVLSIADALSLVPRATGRQTMKDFKSDQEVRWCPGCGDYAVLAAVQSFMPELGIPRENTVFISGIGCSSRFPYYMNTYGMHSIHGRAPAIATGLSTSRQDLSVWVVTGDGDALSIGGNHLIHALRRNVNLKILLFNNRIYGLTKGQYSPTSETGKITKSTPMGSLDAPFNPVSLAIGAEASFVARTIDSDRKHLTDVLRAAAAHPGTALVEIYQNCNIFNDGAFDTLKDKEQAQEAVIRLEHGQPIRFGTDNTKGVIRDPHTGDLQAVTVTPDNEHHILTHNTHTPSPTTAFALSRLANPDTLHHTPIGVFRDIQRPVYDTLLNEQLDTAVEQSGQGDLSKLLAGNDTWTVVG